MTSSRRCSCGGLNHEITPDQFRQAAALVTAEMTGEPELFDVLYDEAGKELVPVLCAALHAVLSYVAEMTGQEPLAVVETFALSAEQMAAAAEAGA